MDLTTGKLDMTKDNIKKVLIKFAIPMILSLITQQLYNIADMIIVGKYLGLDELAAVGNAGTVILILVTLSGGLEMGSEIIFAKYAGNKKYKDILIGVKSIIVFGLISGIILSISGFIFSPFILNWLKVPGELLTLTKSYITVYIAGMACVFLYDISRAIIVALGDAKSSMFLLIFTSALNILLDLLFICFFKLGVGGAALATIIAQFLGMAIAFILLKKKLKPLTKEYQTSWLDFKKIREILSISIPTIIQQLILSLSALFLQSIVNPFGSKVISGYLAVNKIMLFGMLIIIGLSQALSIFTAANSRDENLYRVKEAYGFCIKISTIYLIILTGINFLIPKYLIGIFIDIKNNIEAYEFARNYLQFSLLAYFAYGFKILNENLLRGFSRMKDFLRSNLSDLFCRMIFTYLFVYLFALHGFWMGNMFGKIVSLLISVYAIKKGNLFTNKLHIQKENEKRVEIN
ncbi:MAG: MATE family efflux transporter [Anaerocolumna sp.]